MRATFLLIIMCFSSTAFTVEYIPQPIHERILFGDSWRGAYVRSFINKDWNRVRFEYCGTKPKAMGSCRQLVTREMRQEELPAFTNTLLGELYKLRLELSAEIQQSFVQKLRRNQLSKVVTGKLDLDTLDEIIRSLETEGLENWILLRRDQKLAPRFGSPETSDRAAEIFERVLRNPKPVPPAPAPAPTPETTPVVTGVTASIVR